MKKTAFFPVSLSPFLLAAGLLNMQAKAEPDTNPDIAVDEKTAEGLNLPAIRLDPLQSVDIPAQQGSPTEHIKRVLLYGTAGIPTLYLVLQMSYSGSEPDALHIAGIFNGYPDKEHTQLILLDMDKDGVPEVIMRYLSGTDASNMRIFRFAKNPEPHRDDSNLPFGAFLPHIGHFISGLDSVTLDPDGSVIVHDYTDEGREKAITKKYRLVDGVMKEMEK